MKPSEFTAFVDAEPKPHKWLIVTNNLLAEDAFGKMSHVWLTTFWTQGQEEWQGLVTFTDGDQKIIRLTHWKYA